MDFFNYLDLGIFLYKYFPCNKNPTTESKDKTAKMCLYFTSSNNAKFNITCINSPKAL